MAVRGCRLELLSGSGHNMHMRLCLWVLLGLHVCVQCGLLQMSCLAPPRPPQQPPRRLCEVPPPRMCLSMHTSYTATHNAHGKAS